MSARLACLLLIAAGLGALPTRAQTIRVDATPAHAVNTFSPRSALGSTVDRVPSDATDVFFQADQIKQVLEAGWGTISYRQNTDLFVQAWHWNPKGTWSDPSGKGYFVGDQTPTEMIRHSYGYSLPHRGFTRNNGTEFDGYSRLDDGDLDTYWKSNPYLTQLFTNEDDSLHPQWVVVDLGELEEVNAIRIAWADPYAVTYQAQYWTGRDAMDDPASGKWRTFRFGDISGGGGGVETLADPTTAAVETRFVRVLMTASSHTCDTHGATDIRNCVGYAIREIYVGTMGKDGKFTDLLRHLRAQKQTLTYCSSVDPWHEQGDLYVAPKRMESGDQPGLDLFFTSGITRGLPAIIPIAMLYSTPEDAAAEIAYVEKRGYPIRYIEMGEEPDGQYILPEDDAALYLEFAEALYRVDPKLKLGGPVFEGVDEDIKAWADGQGRTSWFGRFLDYLKRRGRIEDLAFMSFEHYPYDGCQTPWKDLYKEPRLLTHIMQVWRDDGLPSNVPLLDTETNAHGGEAAVDIFGALWLGDTFGAFLTAGGEATFYYHDLPYSPPHPACPNSWGTYHMFMVDTDYEIRSRTSQFYAAQLITEQWVSPTDDKDVVFKASSNVRDPAGNALVTAYAVQRPGGEWSLLAINKDHDHAHAVRVVFEDSGSRQSRTFTGRVTLLSFGRAQYEWHPNRKNGYADPNLPPVVTRPLAGPDKLYVLPPASINVLRGQVGDSSPRRPLKSPEGS